MPPPPTSASTPPKRHIVNPYLKKRKREEESTETVNNTVNNHNATTSAPTPKLAATNTTTSTSTASALIISAADKAGMEGIDRSKIDAIILRESGDSAYMQQQRKRDEKVNVRIQQMKERLAQHTGKSYGDLNKIDQQLEQYQRQTPSRSTKVVIDMDMFYMACELLTRPHLRDVPACVGGGMITTSNYVARRYGVRSAMAGFIGDKLVEELSGGKLKLVHVKSNFDLYKEKSAVVKDVLREYDPHNIKSYSLDEAYFDLAPYLAIHLQHKDWSHEQIRDELLQNKEDHTVPNAMKILQQHSSLVCMEITSKIVAELRKRVEEATGGLSCSAGVAPNVSLAKIASDKNKPNGQLLVDPSRVLDFVHPLPIRKIPGIGRVTEKMLQQVCNVHTVKELYDQRSLVQWLFKPATAEFLLKASVGCSGSGSMTASDFGMEDGDEATQKAEANDDKTDHQKGISRERTFSPESDWNQLCNRLEDIARKTASDMSRKSVMAHTVTVKVKLASFDVMSRAQSMKREVYIQDPEELAVISHQLFSQIRAQFKKDHSKDGKRFSVRLLGVRCSNLISEESFEGSERGSMFKYLKSQDDKDTLTGNGEESGINGYASQRRGSSPKRSLSPTPFDAPNIQPSTSPKTQPTIDVILEQAREKATETTESNTREEQQPTAATQHDEFVQCPICSRQFPADANTALNMHIDSCLNSSTVRRAIQEENTHSLQPAKPEPKKPKRLSDFWGSAKTKL